MAVQFQFRRGTSSDWTSANTVLAAGELGLESDTNKFKIGNGSLGWNSLSYASGTTGPQGATGTAGTIGVNGVTGPAGPTGAQGPVGAQGVAGDGGVGAALLADAKFQLGMFFPKASTYSITATTTVISPISLI
jgi:hypothetical protein